MFNSSLSSPKMVPEGFFLGLFVFGFFVFFWPGEGMRSPTRERRENGPDSDRSLVIASLVKFHKVSLTKHHMMQRSLGKVACSLPQHLSG